MTTIVQSLRQELAALEADIRSDPRYRKIERIRALLSEYENELQASVAPQPNVWHRRNPMADTKKDRVRGVIAEVLTINGSVHRSELLKTLIEKGIMGQEKDPMASLAAYLSDFKEFKNIGVGQWAFAPQIGDAPALPLSSPQGETEAVGASVRNDVHS